MDPELFYFNYLMRSFRRLVVSTLVAVYVLILVGGVVRSTGSGMGCPDWPKCFGSWVPPRSAAELPANYKEIYSEYRHKKNVRFAKYLDVLGMDETAHAILNDETIREEADFNPLKTQIEYGNRIVGVIIGILIFCVFVASLKFRKTNRHLTIISLVSLLLVVFQGWIGSFVVSTNLTPWTVTVHMFLALVLVAFLIILVDETTPSDGGIATNHNTFWLSLACIALLLVQIFLGTNVREAIDTVSNQFPRTEWIANITEAFTVHRSFSWVILIIHFALVVNLMKTEGAKPFSLGVILLILGTILTGVGMGYFAVPAWLQPLHLLLATVTIGVLFLLMLKLNRKRKKVLVN